MNGFRRAKLILIVSNLNDYLSNSFVVRPVGANIQFHLNKAFLIFPIQNVILPNSFIAASLQLQWTQSIMVRCLVMSWYRFAFCITEPLYGKSACPYQRSMMALQWRHNERDGVSNHQPHDCLLRRFIQAQIKENITDPRHWPLCREFTGDRWIPRTKGQ